MKVKEIAIGVFAVLLVGALAFLWFSPSGLKQAPKVTVTTLDHGKISLDKYRGRPVLVTFWATTCPGCVAEMPHLVELHKELAPQGLAIVGIAMSYDPPEQVQEMVKQKQLPYTVALDTDGAAAKAFGGVKLTPTSFLIDPQGRIVKQKLGEMDMKQVRLRILSMLNKPGAA
jgi:peroxiredoxin